MTTLQPAHEPALTFDFRPTLQENRLKGLWQMMSDYRMSHIAATIALALWPGEGREGREVVNRWPTLPTN